jgi:hypothetical protein
MAVCTMTNASAKIVCDALVDRCEEGAGTGLLKLYDGAVQVAEVVLKNPAFGAATTANPAVATADPPDAVVAIGDGPAVDGYKVTNAAGTVLWTGDVTLVGAGGSLTLDNTNVLTGQTVTIVSFTHSVPGGAT